MKKEVMMEKHYYHWCQKNRLIDLLKRLLDEEEFLSDGGIRALSKYHEENPYSVTVEGNTYSIQYDPGDSTSDMFGGNSNWRGPVWMPINFLIIQSIRKYGEFYGDTLLVEYPTGSGNKMNLMEVANELTKRVISLFEKDSDGNRRLYGKYSWFYQQPGNEHLVDYFMNIFMAILEEDWAPVIKPGGRHWWQN